MFQVKFVIHDGTRSQAKETLHWIIGDPERDLTMQSIQNYLAENYKRTEYPLVMTWSDNSIELDLTDEEDLKEMINSISGSEVQIDVYERRGQEGETYPKVQIEGAERRQEDSEEELDREYLRTSVSSSLSPSLVPQASSISRSIAPQPTPKPSSLVLKPASIAPSLPPPGPPQQPYRPPESTGSGTGAPKPITVMPTPGQKSTNPRTNTGKTSNPTEEKPCNKCSSAMCCFK